MTNQLDKKSQAWSALFSEPMSELVKRYTASVTFDQRLWQADIDASLAHAEMLAAQGIISRADAHAIRAVRDALDALSQADIQPIGQLLDERVIALREDDIAAVKFTGVIKPEH